MKMNQKVKFPCLFLLKFIKIYKKIYNKLMKIQIINNNNNIESTINLPSRKKIMSS